MNPRLTIRKIVAASADTPGLQAAYRAAYRLGLHTFLRRAASPGATAAVYSRNSYAQDTHRPGVSDIDLLWIVGADISPDRLYDLVLELAKRFASHHRIFPVLQPFQVVMYHDLLRAWRLGWIRSETYAWRCEFGTDLLASVPSGPSPGGVDSVLRAVHIFATGFHANLREVTPRSGETHYELKRSVRKILRSLDSDESYPAGRARAEDLVSHALILLDQAIGPIEETLTSDPPHSFPVVGLGGGRVTRDSEPSGTVPAPAAVRGVLAADSTGEQVFVVLDPQRPREELASAVAFFLEHPRFGPARTMFLTPRLWTTLLRHIRPSLYYALARSHVPVTGEDLLAPVPPPTSQGILRSFSRDASWLLMTALSVWIRHAAGRADPISVLLAMERRLGGLRFFLENRALFVGNHLPPEQPEVGARLLGSQPRIFDAMQDLRQQTAELVDRHLVLSDPPTAGETTIGGERAPADPEPAEGNSNVD